MKWIPCNEKMPNEDELVLVSGEYIKYPCVITKGKYVHYRYSNGIINFAWMPLPQPYNADRKTEPQFDKDINVRSKDEPQIEKCPFDDSLPCEWVCTEFGKCKYKPQTEPQTEKPKIRKRIDKPFRAVWLDDDHNEIGTPQTDCSWK